MYSIQGGSRVRIVNTNFACVELIRALIVSVLIVLCSVLGDPAKSLCPVLVDRNGLILRGVAEIFIDYRNSVGSISHDN
jgi:hypothetical protein